MQGEDIKGDAVDVNLSRREKRVALPQKIDVIMAGKGVT
jgi:hypothetical protein